MKTSKIIFASDFAPIRVFAPIMAADPEKIYGDLLGTLRSADLNIVNLESPLAGPGEFIAKSGAAFTGGPEHVAALTAGGFTVAVCANNHTFDRGEAGFFRTRDLLTARGVAAVGAGKDLAEARRELALTVGDTRIALFTISEGEDMRGATETTPGVRPWEVERLSADIRAARSKYDVIMVSAHCGLENQPYPSFYVYEAFRQWAAAGADILIGHHPHVPQGVTSFSGVPAYFSLGNFVFYQPVRLFYRKTGFLLEMTCGGGRLLSHRPIPYRIGDEGLRLLAGTELDEFHADLARLSAPLASPETARAAWHAVLAANGVAGFEAELARILETMRQDPIKGAAMLRNRVTCVQHSTQWIDGMSRIMAGSIGDAPAEMVATVREFLTREIGQ